MVVLFHSLFVFPNASFLLPTERGQKFRAGDNVGMGRDHTLFAKADGIVTMTKLTLNNIGGKKTRNVVHVVS